MVILAGRSLLRSTENFLILFENKKMSSTDKIYYGCATRYSDKIRLLIAFENGKKCNCATSNPYWKDLSTI